MIGHRRAERGSDGGGVHLHGHLCDQGGQARGRKAGPPRAGRLCQRQRAETPQHFGFYLDDEAWK